MNKKTFMIMHIMLVMILSSYFSYLLRPTGQFLHITSSGSALVKRKSPQPKGVGLVLNCYYIRHVLSIRKALKSPRLSRHSRTEVLQCIYWGCE